MILISGPEAWVQISLPVEASSATMELFFARTKTMLSTTSGLKKYRLWSPVEYVQATSSFATFERLICSRAEYWAESAPPLYSDQLWCVCAKSAQDSRPTASLMSLHDNPLRPSPTVME